MGIVAQQVVGRRPVADFLEIRVAQGVLVLHRDAVDVVFLGLAAAVADRLRVDDAVAVRVVVGRHVFGEVVGALEAVLFGQVARHPVALGEQRQELVAPVEALAGVGIGAVRLHVVRVITGIVDVADDLELDVWMGVLVDVLHRQFGVDAALVERILQAAVGAGAGLASEGRARLQVVVAAHLERDHARIGCCHERTVSGRVDAGIDARSHGTRLSAAPHLDVLAPQRRRVLRGHVRARTPGNGGRIRVAGVDRIAVSDDSQGVGCRRPRHVPRGILGNGVGSGLRACQGYSGCKASAQQGRAMCTPHGGLSPLQLVFLRADASRAILARDCSSR